MRISERASLALLPVLVLAGCGRADPDAGMGNAAMAWENASIDRTDAAIVATDAVPCSIGNASDTGQQCTVERDERAGGAVLTLRHPDGGFRRLTIVADGRGVVTTDGAEGSSVRVIDPTTIEVSVGDARYRLPAKIARGEAR